MVVGGLIKSLQTVNSMRTCSEKDLIESQCIILETLEQCLLGPKDSSSRIDEASNVKLILQEISQFLPQTNDVYHFKNLQERASKVVYGLSIASFSAVFSRIASKLKTISSDTTNDCSINSAYDLSDIELIQHIHMDLNAVIKLLRGMV
uniref:Uncharacterized protein n=1 Tax=Romanomermis culicivorax TaxID=13658 RepID=A0A915KPM0_ROMCU